MILFVHLLSGAAIASLIKNPALAVILAFLSHYVLDFIPHNEYSINNLFNKNWRQSFPVFLKIMLDFASGIILILIFSQRTTIIFIAAFFAILPDGFSVINERYKIFKWHYELHRKKIHYFKNKKIPAFWRIFSQLAIAFASVVILLIR